MQKDSSYAKSHFLHLLPKMVSLLLVALGLATLAWVGQLIWYDITEWGKGITLILFGSRTGENISLGIRMKVIHYFLMGLALLLLGLLVPRINVGRSMRLHLGSPVEPLENKIGLLRTQCFHHFGYLSSLHNFESVPQECLTCKRMLECRNVTIARTQ